MTRILEAHGIAGIEHETSGQIQAVLNTRHDDHLIRGAADTPGRAQIIGDGLPQRAISTRVAVGQQRPARPAQAPAGDLGPQLERKFLDRWLWPKWPWRRARHLRNRTETVAESGKDRRFAWRRQRDRPAPFRGREILRQERVDIRPRPHPPFEIPLGLEQVKSRDGRATRQTVVRRQIACRRQFRAALQPAVEDRRSNLLIEPLVQRGAGIRALEGQVQRGTSLRHPSWYIRLAIICHFTRTSLPVAMSLIAVHLP